MKDMEENTIAQFFVDTGYVEPRHQHNMYDFGFGFDSGEDADMKLTGYDGIPDNVADIRGDLNDPQAAKEHPLASIYGDYYMFVDPGARTNLDNKEPQSEIANQTNIDYRRKDLSNIESASDVHLETLEQPADEFPRHQQARSVMEPSVLLQGGTTLESPQIIEGVEYPAGTQILVEALGDELGGLGDVGDFEQPISRYDAAAEALKKYGYAPEVARAADYGTVLIVPVEQEGADEEQENIETILDEENIPIFEIMGMNSPTGTTIEITLEDPSSDTKTEIKESAEDAMFEDPNAKLCPLCYDPYVGNVCPRCASGVPGPGAMRVGESIETTGLGSLEPVTPHTNHVIPAHIDVIRELEDQGLKGSGLVRAFAARAQLKPEYAMGIIKAYYDRNSYRY